MQRPVGVTASAVVAMIGSAFILLLAAMMVVSLFVVSPPPGPPNSKQLAVWSATLFAVIAGTGIWTSIGLFRLRPWARTAIIVLAVFVAGGSAFALILTQAIPIPPQFSAGAGRSFRELMLAMYGIPLAIAIWWLVQFNSPSTKAAFASPDGVQASSRPLSISIIAWASIFGGVSGFLALVLGAPAFIFGIALSGWEATLFYIFFALLSFYIGKGLLDLREGARLVAIGWLVFTVINTGAITLIPAWRERMLAIQRSLAPANPDTVFPVEGMVTDILFAVALIVAAAAIFFLIRNRPAFARRT